MWESQPGLKLVYSCMFWKPTMTHCNRSLGLETALLLHHSFVSTSHFCELNTGWQQVHVFNSDKLNLKKLSLWSRWSWKQTSQKQTLHILLSKCQTYTVKVKKAKILLLSKDRNSDLYFIHKGFDMSYGTNATIGFIVAYVIFPSETVVTYFNSLVILINRGRCVLSHSCDADYCCEAPRLGFFFLCSRKRWLW